MRALITLALLVCIAEAKWWMEQPYGDDEFNVRVEYGEDATIKCEDSRINGTQYSVEYWILPDLTIMREDEEISFKTLDGDAGWKTGSNLNELELYLVQERHFGFYHCLAVLDNPIEVNGKNETHFLVKRATNFKGPYFEDLWDDYRMNVIVGCSSAVAFLIISSAIYGLYMYMGKRRGASNLVGVSDESDIPENIEVEKANGLDNEAFSTEQETTFTDEPEKSAVDQPENVQV